MSIEDKLLEAFHKWHSMAIVRANFDNVAADKFTTEIKQAFADENFVKLDPGNFLGTGQQWYDRFDTELHGRVSAWDKSDKTVVDAVRQCLEAARKASGLE